MDVLVITYKPYGFVIYIIPTCSFMEFFFGDGNLRIPYFGPYFTGIFPEI
jgi:hypothetical protein